MVDINGMNLLSSDRCLSWKERDLHSYNKAEKKYCSDATKYSDHDPYCRILANDNKFYDKYVAEYCSEHIDDPYCGCSYTSYVHQIPLQDNNTQVNFLNDNTLSEKKGNTYNGACYINDCNISGYKYKHNDCSTLNPLPTLESKSDEYIDQIDEYIKEPVLHKKAYKHPDGILKGIKSIGGYSVFFKSLF